MGTQWLTALWALQTLFILIGVIIFLITPTSGKRKLWELGALLIVSFLTDATTMAGYFIFRVNMNIVTNLFQFVNLPLVLILYGRNIPWKNIRLASNIMIVAFLVFATVDVLFMDTLTGFAAYTNTLSSLVVILVSLLYFYVLIQQMPTETITRLPMFWINTAFLMYHAGNFTIYVFVNYLIQQKNNLVLPWTVHNFLGLIFYAILWYALLLVRTEHRLVSDKK